MPDNKPASPEQNNVRTFYETPAIDRLTGRLTVEWVNKDGPHRIRVHTRLTDMEGNKPSLFSLMRLPQVVKSYRDAKRHPILPDPVPFLVMDAIEFLDERLKPGMKVLEAGGGNSTLWFLGKGCDVHTIEHSADWAAYVRTFTHERLGEEASERMNLYLEHGDDAIARIDGFEDRAFDVILVDCASEFTWRKDCVAAGRSKVKSGGWMCLDNSDHPINWPAVELMKDRRRVVFSGFAPMALRVTQTSFWQM